MKKLLLILVCGVFGTINLLSQEKELAYNFQIGSEYRYSQEVNMLTRQEMMGSIINTESFILGDILCKVYYFDGNNYSIMVSYEKMKVTMNTPYGNMEWNTEADDPANVRLDILKGFINKPFYIKMTKYGKIIDLTGLDDIVEGIINNYPLSDEEKMQVKEQVSQSFGEETFIKSFEQLFNIFPGYPVAIGDKWIIESSVYNNGISINVVTEYEYTEETDDLLVITSNACMKSPEGAQIIEDDTPVDYLVTGIIESKMILDASSGWIVEATQKNHMDITTSVEIPMDGYIKAFMKMITDTKTTGTIRNIISGFN